MWKYKVTEKGDTLVKQKYLKIVQWQWALCM